MRFSYNRCMRPVRMILAAVLCLAPFELLAQNAKWFEASSPHFEVFTDTSEAKAKRLLVDFEGRTAALAAALGPIPERQFPIEIFLFNKSEDFVEAVPTGLVRVDKNAYLQKGVDRTFVV